MSVLVAWHDLECGAYAEDFELWLELAADPGLPPGPILDVGAGTGRVALELARAGHEVVALDLESDLLAALRDRAGALPVTTVVADARSFALGRRFRLILVPMQTLQLLDGHHVEFLACAAEHLEPGGLIAAALSNPPPYDGEIQPFPDMRERDGWLWSSQPVAMRAYDEGIEIERVRELVAPDGRRKVSEDRIRLRRLTGDDLERAAIRAGLSPLPRREIPETDDYSGSEVVVLRG